MSEPTDSNIQTESKEAASSEAGSSSATLPKTKKDGISEQNRQAQKMLKVVTIVEIVIFAILSILNIWSVHELTEYDPYYKLYYFYAIAGVIMIVLLCVAYFRKWLAFQFMSVIIVMLWATYCAGTVYSCRLMVRTKKLEEPYMHAEMYVVFEGKVYTWEGKTVIYGLPPEWEDLDSHVAIVARDDSGIPTQELHSKGINEGCMIYYQEDYKYILVEVVTGSLFEFIDPDDPPGETISTATTAIGVGI